jgi:putative membrane protein
LVKTEKTLILCIDGDNDIGMKAKITTPVVGRQTNLESATSLAISDPEEADANAMFGAIKLYDQLAKQYTDESFEVATIAGSNVGGVEADRNMVKELSDVLKEFQATGVILVTDGFSDEELVPIIQSRIPITSIHHVVVKHSERIEETYAVIFRYMKMLIEDPYYSKVSLGVPGILLLIFGFLVASNQVENAGMVMAIVMGIILMLKGFGWDQRIAELRPRLPPPERWINIVSTGLGGIVFLVGVIQGVNYAWGIIPLPVMPIWDFTYWAANIADLLGAFIIHGADMISLGIGISILGDGVSTFIQDREDVKVWGNVIGLIFLLWMRPIVIEAAKVLRNPGAEITMFSPLIIYTILGAITTIIAVTWIYRRVGRELFSRNR